MGETSRRESGLTPSHLTTRSLCRVSTDTWRLANSLAMKIAGVDRKVKDVSGGTIVRDVEANLTGIFKDNAMDLISVKIPPASVRRGS